MTKMKLITFVALFNFLRDVRTNKYKGIIHYVRKKQDVFEQIYTCIEYNISVPSFSLSQNILTHRFSNRLLGQNVLPQQGCFPPYLISPLSGSPALKLTDPLTEALSFSAHRYAHQPTSMITEHTLYYTIQYVNANP